MWIAEALREIKNALKDKKPTPGTAAETGKNNRRNEPRAEVVVREDEPKHSTGGENEKNRTPKWVMVVPTWITAIATFAAAGGAIIYAHIAAQQACIMNQTLGEIQRQTPLIRQSAEAASAAADAARDSVQATGNAMYQEQRPWVGIEALPVAGPNYFGGNTVVGPGPAIRVASVKIVAHNSGKTPALRWKPSCMESMDVDFTRDTAQIPSCEELRKLNLNRDIDEMAERLIPKMPPAVSTEQSEKLVWRN